MIVDLDRAPSLLPLYLRALLPRRGSRGSLPEQTLRLRGVRPDTAHVADYTHLCGFRLTGYLPVTYPQLIGFPLQMALLADREFPFAATGLVHVANEITQRRAIPLGAALDVTVHATGPTAHPRGRTVDMHTQVSVDDEPLWTSRSTYLRRGQGDPSASPRHVDVRMDLPTAAIWRLPADTGRRYAAVSGDPNPIHLHRLTARALGFPRAIAHGMYTAAAALATLEGRLPEDVRVEVEFKAPLLLPSTVELGTRVGDDVAELVVRSPTGRPHVLVRAERNP